MAARGTWSAIEPYMRKERVEGCPPHHWILDDSNFGICKKCGAEKQFPTLKEIDELIARRMLRKAQQKQRGVEDIEGEHVLSG